jgi:hypothetical protein
MCSVLLASLQDSLQDNLQHNLQDDLQHSLQDDLHTACRTAASMKLSKAACAAMGNCFITTHTAAAANTSKHGMLLYLPCSALQQYGSMQYPLSKGCQCQHGAC